MAFDRKPGGFGGNRGSGGFRSGGGRPPFRKAGFGAPRRDERPAQMHPATCANCGAATEVPFRPDGSRPIYCKDCLAKREPLRRDVAPRRDFGAGRESPRYERRDHDVAPRAAAPDKRIDELLRTVATLSSKVDSIATQLSQMTAGTKEAVKQEGSTTAAKPSAKAAPKKESKKAVKKAVPASKPVAKKTAKKTAKK